RDQKGRVIDRPKSTFSSEGQRALLKGAPLLTYIHQKLVLIRNPHPPGASASREPPALASAGPGWLPKPRPRRLARWVSTPQAPRRPPDKLVERLELGRGSAKESPRSVASLHHSPRARLAPERHA